MSFRIVPATRAHLEEVGKGRPLPHTVRAVAVLDEDGALVGVGGVAYRGAALEVFSDVKPALKAHPMTLMRATKIVLSWIDRPAFATADPDEPTADSFLRRLGFEPKGEFYTWHG